MAEKVEIDIPGIGLIEAKNAASEATLLEILDVLKNTQKDNNKNAKQQNKGQNQNNQPAPNMKNLQQQANSAAKGLGAMAQAGKLAGQAVQTLGYAAGAATQTVTGLAKFAGVAAGATFTLGKMALGAAESMTSLIEELANVGDSTTSAAASLRHIPIVGGALAGIFGAVAGAAENVVKSFQTAASVGATFGGSVQDMSRAASGAGMTLDKFAQLIQANGENLMMLGGTTEAGAKQFAQLAKGIQSSQLGSELQRMGYSTEQINGSMARHIGMLGKTGALQGMTTQQLIASSGAYMKELDALAKITGVSREEKEKEQAALMADAKVRAALAGLDADQQRQMMAYITSFPKEQQAAIADMIATGNTTTEEAIQLQSLLPGVAQRTMEFGRTLQAGGKINQDALNQAKNSAILEAQESVKRNKMRGMFDEQAGKQYVGAANLAAQKVDGFSQAIGEQAKAAEKNNLAEQLTKAKQRLAEFSNGFQMALANSGLLDALLTTFQTLATFVQVAILPIFNVLASAISSAVPLFANLLMPAIKKLGEFVSGVVIPGFEILGYWIKDAVVPIFKEAWKVVSDVVGGLFSMFGITMDANDGLATFEEVLYEISYFIEDHLGAILTGFGVLIGTVVVGKVLAFASAMVGVMAPLASFIGAVATATFNLAKMAVQVAFSTLKFLVLTAPLAGLALAITAGVVIFKKLGGDMQVFADSLKWVGSWISTLFLKLQYGIYSLLNKIPGMRGDFDNDLKDISAKMDQNEKDRAKLEQDMANRMKANRDKAASDEQAAIEARRQADARAAKDASAAQADAADKQESREEKEARRDEERRQRAARREQDADRRRQARDKREQDAADQRHRAEMGNINERGDRERAQAEGKDVTVDMADPIQMLKTFAAQQKSAYTQEAKALDDKEKAQSELAMASSEYAKAIEARGKATNDLERKAAEDRVKAAEDRLKKANTANTEADAAVNKAVERMKLAKEGKDPGAAEGRPRDERQQGATKPEAAGKPATAAGPQEGVKTDAAMAKYLQTIALIESGGNKNAKASTSSASGMFQFVEGTWKQMTKEMGKNYTLEDRFDPKKAAEVAEYFSKKQKAQVERGIGREAGMTDMYMAHFLGAGGATKFLKAKDQNPQQSAAALDPAAAKANKNIYYTKEGRERTVQEVYDLMDQKVKKQAALVEKGKVNADVAAIGGGAYKPGQPVAAVAPGTPASGAGGGRGERGGPTAEELEANRRNQTQGRPEQRPQEGRQDQRPQEGRPITPLPEAVPANAMQNLISNGIVPTTIAFQDLVNKGLKPFQGMMSGMQVKTPLDPKAAEGAVKPEDSLKKGEEIINKVRGLYDTEASKMAVGMAEVQTATSNFAKAINPETGELYTPVDLAQPKMRGANDNLAASETAKLEIIAQKEKEAQEKARAAEEAAAQKEKEAAAKSFASNNQEGTMGAGLDLNTALAELIAINKRTAELNEQQLSVQSQLSGDLYG